MLIGNDVRLHALVVHQVKDEGIAQVRADCLLLDWLDAVLLIVAVQIGVPLSIWHRCLLHFFDIMLLTDYPHRSRIILSE